MLFSGASFWSIVYITSVYLFGIYLRYLHFQDYFHCYACKELNLRDQNYDYIVGSGSAGSIVAQRLSENKNVKILLIEAGSGGDSLLQIPSIGVMLQKSDFDWQYRTVPQKHACLGLNKKVSLWPMGKILGGTAMLNNMVYVRGHPEDFQRWYQAKSDFDYKNDILPYFEKLENSDSKKKQFFLSEAPYRSNISDHILKAGTCMGAALSDGLNSQPGFSKAKLTMNKGQRWTKYHQLSENKSPKLKIVTNALVEKILFRNETEAYGVKFKHLEGDFIAKASKGVILCAGAIGTPKILMLSGIGPSDHLKKMKILPKIDLPVGNNLQDHVTTGLDLVTMDYPSDLGIKQMFSLSSAFNYFIKSKGPWTSAGCENIGFFNLENKNIPEIQLMMFPIGVTVDDGLYLRHLTGIGDKVWEKYFSQIKKPSLSVLPIVLHPKSRGTVRLKNKNPQTPPVIDPNYLSNNYDVDILIQGIELIKKMISSSPMKRLGARLNNVTFPGCGKFEFDTRPYWECYVRHLTFTVYHPVGTCKLGEVVDYSFKVKGTSNLYVVDGSVLPDLPSGNPNGAIMMMAEKAADSIKRQCWKNQNKCCSAEVFSVECQR